MNIEARKCPYCGNDDYDDDFKTMICSECGSLYDVAHAERVYIKEEFN